MVLTQAISSALIAASLANAYTSDNWAGGIHEDKGRVTQATVDIVVPECSVGIPAYNYVPYSVSGWAGIDGSSSCNDVVLQAGRCSSQVHLSSQLLIFSQASIVLQSPRTTRLRRSTMLGLNGIPHHSSLTTTSSYKPVTSSRFVSWQTRRHRGRHSSTTIELGSKRTQVMPTRRLHCAWTLLSG
jgi:hypothetical protein